MPQELTPSALLAELASLPRGDDLARLVHTVAFAAADEHRTTLTDGLAEAVDRAGIASDEATMSSGNVLTLLGEKGPHATSSRTLLSVLLARGVALFLPDGEADQTRVAESLLWLATNGPIDAFPALDAALGSKAEGLWRALAGILRATVHGEAPQFNRAACIVGAVALRDSSSSAARAVAEAFAGEVSDPVVRLVLSGPEAGGLREAPTRALSGELMSPPRSSVALVALALTGILVVIEVARLIARFALGYRAPAELRVSARGVTVHAKTELLGRTVREREVTIPLAALAKATRETRYPRVLLYSGLCSLAIGSYLGIGLCIDGARSGSPELLGIGALLIAAGLALDFVLENARSGLGGKCRVVFLPRRGPALAIGHVDPSAADAILRSLLRG